jgi:hypothetical protein
MESRKQEKARQPTQSAPQKTHGKTAKPYDNKIKTQEEAKAIVSPKASVLIQPRLRAQPIAQNAAEAIKGFSRLF